MAIVSSPFYSEILNALDEGFVVQDKVGAIIYFNLAASKILGLSEDQLLGRTSMDPRWNSIKEDGSQFLGEDHPAMYTIRTGLPKPNIVMGVQIPDKGLRWLRVSSIPFVREFEGKKSAALTTFNDISKQIEKSKLISGIVANSPGMLYQFRVAADGKASFPFVSPKAYEIYDISEEELVLDPDLLMKLIHEEDRAGLFGATAKSTATMTAFNWQGRIKTRKGQIKWVQINGIPRKDADGSVVSDGILMDITREIEVQKELAFERERAAHTAKLASLGRMSGGVAHEINNPLAIIAGMSKLLTTTAHDSAKLEARVAKISNAVDRISNIVNGLKRFSRTGEKTVRDRCEVKTLMNEVMNLTLSKVHKNGVHLKVEGDLKAVIVCDQAEVEQVLTNLIENAVDAIRGLSEKWIKVEVVSDSKSVKFKVVDSGRGIPPEISAKIFDPFFTTKEVGEGTGLGLSMSRGIIKDHGGELRIVPGENTCFEVELPIVRSNSY